MTRREAVYTLWTLAGEPSDLDPMLATAPYNAPEYIDASTPGTAHYLRELSMAQNLLANWRTSRGRPIRFKKFQVQKNVRLGLPETTAYYDADYIDSTTLRINAAPLWFDSSVLEGCKLVLTQTGLTDGEEVTDEQDHMIMIAEGGGNGAYELYLRDEITEASFTVLTYTVKIEFDRFQIVEGQIFTGGYQLMLPPLLRNITKITELSSGTALLRNHTKESLHNQELTSGTPSEYYILGDVVYMDVYLEEPIWFIVEYQRLPNELVGLDGDIDIPTQWHAVLMLIAEWQAAERAMDTEKGMVKRSQITGLINTLRTDEEEDWLREEAKGLYVQTESR